MKHPNEIGGLLPALLTAVLLVAGCKTVRYETRPPASEAGRACVTQCAAIRETCRGNEIMRARNEREACQQRAEKSLRKCLASADSNDKRKECEKNKSGCWNSEDYDRCDADYRACYGQCGGTVNKVVE